MLFRPFSFCCTNLECNVVFPATENYELLRYCRVGPGLTVAVAERCLPHWRAIDIAILSVRLSVCLSVCPLRSSILWKRFNIIINLSPHVSPIILVFSRTLMARQWCLSSVTLVHPTQTVKLFGNIFYTILYTRHLGRTMQTFTKIGPRQPLRQGR